MLAALLSRLADWRHERRISAARKAMLDATSHEARREHALTMRGLINRRSAAQVARMEQQKGLV